MLVLFSVGGVLIWLWDDEASRSTTVRLGFRWRLTHSLARARESLERNADSIHFHTLQRNHVIFICGGLDMEESLSSTNWYSADLHEIRLVMSSDWINDLSPPLTYHWLSRQRALATFFFFSSARPRLDPVANHQHCSRALTGLWWTESASQIQSSKWQK